MERWTWIDGAVTPAARAAVAADDRAVLLGDGVFETCGVVDGAPFAIRRHLLRLRSSADRMGIGVPWSDASIRTACSDVIGAATATGRSPSGPARMSGRLRITVTAGSGPPGPDRETARPRLLVSVGPAPNVGSSVDVASVPWPVNERAALAGIKTTSRAELVVALAEAQRRGAREAILSNTRGFLCEASASNVFLVAGGRLVTPGLATGCLPGITRGLVLETSDVIEQDDLTVEDLRGSPEAFVTSSLRGVQPISSVDGVPLRAVMGPLTAAAARALETLASRTLDP